jgi:cell wall-associated NlpC family hydrolase
VTWRARTLWLGIAIALLLVIIAAPAQASPVAAKKARLRAVQAKLDSVGVQVSKAVEDYNQAESRLRATNARIVENQRLLTAATRNLELANQQLTARARDLYKAPPAGIVDAVFSARSFDDLVAQFDLMQRVGNSDVDTVKAVEAYQQDIKDRRIALRADAKVAARLVEKRASEKTKIVALESQLRSESQGLQAQIKRLQAQQQAAAAAAVAAANAASAAGAQTSSGGGSGGSAPVVDPGGPGHPEVVAIAARYLGIPYVWGGASPSQGFDCSGLVLYVYAQVGIGLSHGATDQQHASSPVPLNALQPGDLVFYGNASYSYHVAIYVGGGRTIEAARTGTPVRYGVVGSAWTGGRF